MSNQLFGLAAAISAVIPTIAVAQSADAPTASDAAPEVSAGAGLEEIIVTAQKRAQRLQDVPLTITALSGGDLERSGVSGTRDLTLLTPGLVVATQTVVTQPSLRGVSGRGIGPGDEGTVPIYIDGVYQPVQQANSFRLANIERIEVLKGPQGTLFGRNAVGGAINVLTRDPGRDFEGYVGLRYGSFNERQGELYLSAPITETVGANLSVFLSADDGYIDDLLRNNKVNPASTEAVRAKIFWKIGPGTSLRFSANYAHVVDASSVATHPINGVTSGQLFTPRIIAGEYQVASNFLPDARYHTAGGSVQLQQEFAGFNLTALGSYQHTETVSGYDSDQSPRPSNFSISETGDKTWTGEVRLTSAGGGHLQWIGGIFYYNSEACYCIFDNGGTTTFATQGAEAYALFGEVTYDLTEQLSVTGGLRYSREDRSIETFRNGAFVGRGKDSFSNVSPRLSLIYEISDQSRVYFTYSQGFKSGVYNTSSVVLPLTAVEPEELIAYEIGLKTEPSTRMRFNLSAYYYDYTNLQVSSRAGVGNNTLLQNAAAAEIYGGEAQLDWAPTQYWNLSAGLAYTHAEFVSFPGAQVLTNLPDRSGNMASFRDVSGKAIPKTPELTFSLRTDYTVPLGIGDLMFGANLYYSSELFWDFSNRLRSAPYTAINTQVSLALPNGLTVAGFIENLTNNDRYLTVSSGVLSDNGSEVRPRTYGVKLSYKF